MTQARSFPDKSSHSSTHRHLTQPEAALFLHIQFLVLQPSNSEIPRSAFATMLSRLLLLPVALAMASPTGTHARSEADSDNPLELLLRYHHEPGSNQTEFSLSTPDKTEFYAHACGDTFEVAGKTVTMSVNERGSGNLVVDDKEYKVVGDRKVSGGVSCTKMYNDQSTVVECSIPWRASFEDLEAQSDDVAECFSGESAARRRSLPSTFGPPLSTSSDVEKRQAGACAWYYHDNVSGMAPRSSPHTAPR